MQTNNLSSLVASTVAHYNFSSCRRNDEGRSVIKFDRRPTSTPPAA